MATITKLSHTSSDNLEDENKKRYPVRFTCTSTYTREQTFSLSEEEYQLLKDRQVVPGRIRDQFHGLSFVKGQSDDFRAEDLQTGEELRPFCDPFDV